MPGVRGPGPDHDGDGPRGDPLPHSTEVRRHPRGVRRPGAAGGQEDPWMSQNKSDLPYCLVGAFFSPAPIHPHSPFVFMLKFGSTRYERQQKYPSQEERFAQGFWTRGGIEQLENQLAAPIQLGSPTPLGLILIPAQVKKKFGLKREKMGKWKIEKIKP